MAMQDPEWFRSLVDASFRGIPFKVTQQTREGGIRGADHEYYGRDEGNTENAGNKIERFSFDAYVVGDDYHLGTQDLIVALQSGAGLLIHPRWGERQCICRSWTIAEGLGTQGEARFSLSFTEDLASAGLIWFESEDAIVDTKADELTTLASAEFTAAYSVETEPGVAQESAGLDLLSRISDIRSAMRTPRKATIEDPTALQSALASQAALASTPYAMATVAILSNHLAAIQAIGDLGVLIALARLRRSVLIPDAASMPTNPTEATIASNADATSALIQRVALAEAIKAAKNTDFVVYDEAIAVRDELSELADAEGDTPIDRIVYRTLIDGANALYGWLTSFAEDLAELRDLEIGSVTSSLEIAWDLYADAERAEEIQDRNGIVHGGFIRPGTIQVLSS